MAAATASRRFADSIFARLIALAIAVLIGWVFYVNWADDIRALFADNGPGIPIITQQTPVQTANPALQACLKQRVGDIDKMKSDGVINDAQYASFRERAEQICRAQNPG